MPCPVLTWRMLLLADALAMPCPVLTDSVCAAIVLCAPYAMSGTEIAYAGTRNRGGEAEAGLRRREGGRSDPLSAYAMSGTDIA
eukprot:1098009-Rhodomonas_salina.1